MDTISTSNRWPLTPGEGFRGPANADAEPQAASGTTAPPPAPLSPAPLPPPGRPARWLLSRALRAVDAGPRPFYRAAMASMAVTSALAVAAAALIRPHGPLPAAQWGMMAGALAVACLSAVLGLASRAAAVQPSAPRLDRLVASRTRAAIWLAVACWFPFLLLVVYYGAKATFPPPEQYLYFPYDDKRWETAAYLLGVLAPAIWLTAAARVLAVGRGHPPTWRAWCAGLFPRIAVAAPGLRAGAAQVP